MGTGLEPSVKPGMTDSILGTEVDPHPDGGLGLTTRGGRLTRP